jgi:uncharacterized repeat protein (TIGR01451 family)
MRRNLIPSPLGCGVLLGLLVVLALGVRPASAAELINTYTFHGHGGYSADGLGDTTGSGTIQAEVPPGSHVERAFLYKTFFYAPGRNFVVTLDGASVTTTLIGTVDTLSTARADVTGAVSAKVGSGSGVTDFRASWTDPGNVTGIALVVVYSQPTAPLTTVVVLDGASDQSGTTTTLLFTNPIDLTQPGLSAIMSLGSAYSYQQLPGHQCGGTQFSTVDVNGRRLTSCAGNHDDGVQGAGNSQLMTVGGVGDDIDNPANPNVTSGTDDELYNLEPFLAQGDASMVIHSVNPSRDDNLFLSVISISAYAAVNVPECSDDIDNDGDGKIDYPDDPGCTSRDDLDESDVDLQVRKLVSRDTVSPGEPIDFQVLVNNAGPVDAEDTVVTDALPPGFTLAGVEPSRGSCTQPDPQTLRCALGSLPASGAALIEVRGTAAALGTLSNTATAASAVVDRDPTNNAASARVTVEAAPPPATRSDLVVTKHAEHDAVVAGDHLRYRVTVHNAGEHATDEVILLDLFSLPVHVVSAEIEGAHCSTERPIVCRSGPIGPGQTRTGSIVVVPHETGRLRNAVMAGGDVGVLPVGLPALGSLDNAQVVGVSVRARLRVALSPARVSRRPGTDVTYRVRITASRATVTGARACFRGGAGLAIRTDGLVRVGAATCWTVPALAAGAHRDFIVRVRSARSCDARRRLRAAATVDADNAEGDVARAYVRLACRTSSRAPAVTG